MALEAKAGNSSNGNFVPWMPLPGDEAHALMDFKADLPASAKQEILSVAQRILGNGVSPTPDDEKRTGLVVGYVQSGKTLSFTTAIALAKDNNFPMIIVVGGTTEILFGQTVDRLLEDLQVNAFDGPPRWVHLRNPALGNRQIVEGSLNVWHDAEIPREEKATLLLTVMKHHQRIDNLNALLDELDLHNLPVLVIDDEADQASLNVKVNRSEQSTTYERLVALRDRIPHHTFLQYTATPQAPLLINIIDVLSPGFVDVLNPGGGYVGGQHFFGGSRHLVRAIPEADIPSADNRLDSAPGTLLSALREFFIGVSASLIITRWSKENPNRSMLVHPSRTTLEHFQFFQSIQAIKEEWLRVLALPESDPDRRDLVAELVEAYRSLSGTVGNSMPPFEAVLARLPRDMRATQIREVNRRPGNRSSDIDWRQAYAWILVGGQKMDRGFTVKELTVTYMPRAVGTGNADTLQQRARFFGYKQNYLGFCRIYLDPEVLAALEAYVAHEEEMRQELIRVRDKGIPLADWKRRFILSEDLKPCRASVIQKEIVRGNHGKKWFFPRTVLMSAASMASNTRLFEGFVRGNDFKLDTTSRFLAQQHAVLADVPLSKVMDDLLIRYVVDDPNDTNEMVGFLLQVSKALSKNQAETAVVYQMRPNQVGSRGVDKQGRLQSIRRLQQGATRSKGGGSYPGDHAFREDARVSVQLHTIDLSRDEKELAKNVPVLAVWLPERLGIDWLVQD